MFVFGGFDWLGDWLHGLLKAAVICKVNRYQYSPPPSLGLGPPGAIGVPGQQSISTPTLPRLDLVLSLKLCERSLEDLRSSWVSDMQYPCQGHSSLSPEWFTSTLLTLDIDKV